MEAWRRARERIRHERLRPVRLVLQPPADVSLTGSTASVALTRHAFRFGANLFMLDGLEDRELDEAYQRQFEALFNYAAADQ